MTPIFGNDLINEPDASRMIFGMRDTGYDFNTAAADIIDNSIGANASEVNVKFDMTEDGRKFVYFGDNGDGMDSDELFKAMRYGAPVRDNLASLGKFGLGMKTASSSICLKFTVISRKSADASLSKLAWDLEHVEAIDEWKMLQEDTTVDEQEYFEELCGDKGTLVIWSKCDRLLSKDYEEPGSTKEQNALKRLADKLRVHAALIYYRFLNLDDSRERSIVLKINGDPVSAWNPFCPAIATQVLPKTLQRLDVVREDGSVDRATIRAFMLPSRRDLTKAEEDEAMIANNRQGFYIHREGRIIQHGNWLGVFGANEPHYSLLRIEFDFNHRLDDAFKVDVKKSRILIDPALAAELKKRLQPFYREARTVYDRKKIQTLIEKGVDHDSANKAIRKTTTTNKPDVISTDPDNETITISNNRGAQIKLRVPVENQVDPAKIYVEAVETITSGNLWEPGIRSEGGNVDGTNEYVSGVTINKHHDFYLKIYQRAAGSGYAVDGMDFLLWAFAVAEQNNSNRELEPIFEDIRDEISANLKRLLRDVSLPDELQGNNEG